MTQVPHLLVSNLRLASTRVLGWQAGHAGFVLECGSDLLQAGQLASLCDSGNLPSFSIALSALQYTVQLSSPWSSLAVSLHPVLWPCRRPHTFHNVSLPSRFFTNAKLDCLVTELQGCCVAGPNVESNLQSPNHNSSATLIPPPMPVHYCSVWQSFRTAFATLTLTLSSVISINGNGNIH